MRLLPRFLLLAPLASTLAAAPLLAQVQDTAPPDLTSLLQELKKIREQQAATQRQHRQNGMQTVTAAAASGERAAALWEDAVRAVQFEGASKEGTAFKEWKDREGQGLSSKEGRNAARLFFAWLGLTMQRDAGTPTKELLPQVVGYARELAADREAMEAMEESIKKDKELNASGKHGAKRDVDDERTKRTHDMILKRPLAASPVVQWLHLTDFVNPEKWENNPGDYDGIFNNIILPELRTQRDPRLLEYWDMRLKKEAETAGKQRLAFDLEKYNNQRRPQLLWSRAEDMLLIGQKNKAMGEMFGLIKTFPQHPDAEKWIARLETLLLPPVVGAAPAVAPASLTTPAAAAPAGEVVREPGAGGR